MDREQKLQQARTQIDDITKRIGALSNVDSGAQTPSVSVDEIDKVQDIKVTTPEEVAQKPATILSLGDRIAERTEQRDELAYTIRNLEEELVGAADFRKEQFEDLDIEGRRESLNESRKRLLQLEADANNLQTEVEREFAGRTTSTRAINAMIRKERQDLAVRQRDELALFEALQGDLNTSLELIDEAVQLEFSDEEFELGIRKQQLAEIESQLTADETQQYEEQQAIIAEEENRIEAQKQEKKEIRKLVLTAVGNGADAVTRQAMLNSPGIDTAIEIGARFLKDQPRSDSGGADFSGLGLDQAIADLRESGMSNTDIKAYLDTQTDLTVGVINEAVDGPDSDQFISPAYFRGLVGDEGLKAFAKDKGVYVPGTNTEIFGFGLGNGDGDAEAITERLMQKTQELRQAGLRDSEIAKTLNFGTLQKEYSR